MRQRAVEWWWVWLLIAVLAGVVNDLLDRYVFGGGRHIGRDVLIGIVVALIACAVATFATRRTEI